MTDCRSVCQVSKYVQQLKAAVPAERKGDMRCVDWHVWALQACRQPISCLAFATNVPSL